MPIVSSLALLALATPQIAPGEPTASSLGGAYVSPFQMPLSANIAGGRLLEFTLNLPGQTWQERFIIGIPRPMQYPAPVLTLFHGYGEEPANVVQNTALVQEAMSRGWLVFIPLGAHKFNYGIDYAQDNIDAAFEFIGSRLPIDMDRIYAVGFSMGGGAAASYAARHLDPGHVRIAALVNHTGTTSLRATYHTSNDTNLFRSPLMFGGTPMEETFRYLRSSTVDLDTFTGTVDPAGAMAPNLSRVPTRHWYARYDANTSIVEQTVALDNAMQQSGGDSDEVVVQSSIHAWETLDPNVVLDWLEPHRLREPTAGEVARVVADRDGHWHDLEIRRAASDEFAPILFSSQPNRNAMYLIEMANMAEVRFDPDEVALDSDAPLLFVLQTTDDVGTEVVLEGFPDPPTSVERRHTTNAMWTHDPVAGTITLHEPTQAGWAVWSVRR